MASRCPGQVVIPWYASGCPFVRILLICQVIRAPSDQRCHTMQKWRQAILPGGSGCLLGKRKQFNQDCHIAVICSALFCHVLHTFQLQSKVGSQHICLIHHTQNLISGHLSCVWTVTEQPSSWVDFIVNEFLTLKSAIRCPNQMVQMVPLPNVLFEVKARDAFFYVVLNSYQFMILVTTHESHDRIKNLLIFKTDLWILSEPQGLNFNYKWPASHRSWPSGGVPTHSPTNGLTCEANVNLTKTHPCDFAKWLVKVEFSKQPQQRVLGAICIKNGLKDIKSGSKPQQFQ